MSKSPREEQIDKILTELEQVINQLPSRNFYGVVGIMEYHLWWYNSRWYGNSVNLENPFERPDCTASTFQGVCHDIGITLLTPDSARMLLDRAREQRKKC